MSNPEPSTSSDKYPDASFDEFYFQWHITERCNLQCIHCYQESNNRQAELSLVQLKKIADEITVALKKWKKRGRIALSGGDKTILDGCVADHKDDPVAEFEGTSKSKTVEVGNSSGTSITLNEEGMFMVSTVPVTPADGQIYYDSVTNNKF